MVGEEGGRGRGRGRTARPSPSRDLALGQPAPLSRIARPPDHLRRAPSVPAGEAIVRRRTFVAKYALWGRSISAKLVMAKPARTADWVPTALKLRRRRAGRGARRERERERGCGGGRRRDQAAEAAVAAGLGGRSGPSRWRRVCICVRRRSLVIEEVELLLAELDGALLDVGLQQ